MQTAAALSRPVAAGVSSRPAATCSRSRSVAAPAPSRPFAPAHTDAESSSQLRRRAGVTNATVSGVSRAGRVWCGGLAQWRRRRRRQQPLGCHRSLTLQCFTYHLLQALEKVGDIMTSASAGVITCSPDTPIDDGALAPLGWLLGCSVLLLRRACWPAMMAAPCLTLTLCKPRLASACLLCASCTHPHPHTPPPHPSLRSPGAAGAASRVRAACLRR